MGSCKPYEFTDFWLECSETQAGSNLVVQVVDGLDNVDPEALSVHMFYKRIPEDRVTMRFDDSGENHVYRSMNALPALHSSGVPGLRSRAERRAVSDGRRLLKLAWWFSLGIHPMNASSAPWSSTPPLTARLSA